MSHTVRMMLGAAPHRQRVAAFLAAARAADLATLADMVATGAVTPVVERTYQLEQVAEAFSYIAERHVRGKLLVTIP